MTSTVLGPLSSPLLLSMCIICLGDGRLWSRRKWCNTQFKNGILYNPEFALFKCCRVDSGKVIGGSTFKVSICSDNKSSGKTTITPEECFSKFFSPQVSHATASGHFLSHTVGIHRVK